MSRFEVSTNVADPRLVTDVCTFSVSIPIPTWIAAVVAQTHLAPKIAEASVA